MMMRKVKGAIVIFLVQGIYGDIGVRWWQTSEGDSEDRLREKSMLRLMSTVDESVPESRYFTSIEIDGSEVYQEVMGFGGAFTQASATVWHDLDEEDRERLIEAYYDNENGIGYTFGRVPINSCDFSPDTYSFDNVPDDFELKFFDELVQVDADRTIPMIKAAQKYMQKKEDLKILASPWSPPAWMKSNNNMLKGGKVNQTDTMDAWARYIMKWIQSYESYSIPIWGLTVQNEPESAQAWESCEYKAHEEAAFVQDFLGPYLRESFPSKNLFGFDHNKNHLYQWANTIFTNSSFFDGIAFHWYAGTCFHQIQRVAQDFPDKFLLPSEACYELAQVPAEFFNPKQFLHNGTWARGEGYANDILKDLQAGSHGWIDWNLLLDETGGPNHVGNLCDAPVVADTKYGNANLYFHPQYYYMGHFSKFILPKSVRLGLYTSASSTLEKSDLFDDCQGWPVYGACHPGTLKSTAFRRPDGYVAVVVLNCNDDPIQLRLSYKGFGHLNNIVPAHSIQTYLFPDVAQYSLMPFTFLQSSSNHLFNALYSKMNHQFSFLLLVALITTSMLTLFLLKSKSASSTSSAIAAGERQHHIQSLHQLDNRGSNVAATSMA